jgi:hypothetical protein
MQRVRQFVRKLRSDKMMSGQSFVELAFIVPLLLIMLVGVVEIAFAMFAYMTTVDLTREAARFASVRDYRVQDVVAPDDNPSDNCESGDSVQDCACGDQLLDFYRDTACFFTDPSLNSFLEFTADKYDDVVISVLTITDNVVTDRHPNPIWSLNGDNWKKDCHGNVVRTDPFFTDALVESKFVPNATDDRGLVIVEAYICYDLILPLPLISDYIGSPYRIHAYTVMPDSEAIPTPTAIPSP